MSKLALALILGLILLANARPNKGRGRNRGGGKQQGYPIAGPPVISDEVPVVEAAFTTTTESPLEATTPTLNTTAESQYDYGNYEYYEDDDEEEEEDEEDDDEYEYGAGDGEEESDTTLGTAIPAVNDTDASLESLLVRYGQDPAQRGVSDFLSLPLTESEAVTEQWTMDSDACNSLNPTYWRGRRYRLKGDVSLSLIYDYQGALAGVQVAFTPSDPVTYPDALTYRNVFNVEGSLRVGTVYFKPPASICSAVNLTVEEGGQTLGQTLGDQLFIQTGTDPINQYAHIHNSEVELVTKSMWKPGSCLNGLGRHYWFNTTTMTPCNNFVPIALLYNGGSLVGFNWAFRADQQQAGYASTRFEKMPPAFTQTFFENNLPTCLQGVQLATMHFFFQQAPWTNVC